MLVWAVGAVEEVFAGPVRLTAIYIGFYLGAHGIKVDGADKKDTIGGVCLGVEFGHVVIDDTLSACRTPATGLARSYAEAVEKDKFGAISGVLEQPCGHCSRQGL